MLFRPIEPRGDVLEATRHWMALGLLLPLALALVAGQAWLSQPQPLAGMSATAFVLGYLQLLFLPLGGFGARAWIPLAMAIVLTLLLHFVFFMSLLTVLSRMKGLSLVNVLVGTTVCAGVCALLPVLAGYGSAASRYRLPLLEDYAQGFLFYAIALGVGGLLEWICVRTAPPGAALS